MIEIKNLKKKFTKNGPWITNGVTITIPENQTTCIIGRSGEGKSVLLKQIIGLIKPTSGTIKINNLNVSQLSEKELSSVFKEVGYVFQFAALLDSLNVLENIGLPLLEQGKSLKEIEPLVQEKLALVDLSPKDTMYKYPSELSGGMKKRVGLARTLITEPKIILYDEPTTGLDPITTRIIHELIASTQKKLNLTCIVVSHDIEIFKYVDNIALLDERTIKYFGSAKNIWDCKDPYIHQFIRGEIEGPMQSEIVHNKNKF